MATGGSPRHVLTMFSNDVNLSFDSLNWDASYLKLKFNRYRLAGLGGYKSWMEWAKTKLKRWMDKSCKGSTHWKVYSCAFSKLLSLKAPRTKPI